MSLDKKYGSVFWSFLRPEWRGVWRTAASSDGFKESEGAGMPGWNLCFIFVIIYCHAADAMWWNLIKCSNKLRCEILSEIVSGASGRAITASPSPPRLPCFASHSIYSLIYCISIRTSASGSQTARPGIPLVSIWYFVFPSLLPSLSPVLSPEDVASFPSPRNYSFLSRHFLPFSVSVLLFTSQRFLIACFR